MPMHDGIDYELQAQYDAWMNEAIADGTARRAIRAYIDSWRQQAKPLLSQAPFIALCAVIQAAYPDRSEHDNGHVALRIVHWVERVHGKWLTRALEGGR